MATKSFLKSISIKTRKKANAFISALENAENKSKKTKQTNVMVETISDKEKIKKIFGE